MAKIILPYTIQNGNTADGGQVQQDFDAILTQVNGNLDNANLADGAVSTTKLVDGAVTAAKLASDVKVIENIYSIALTDEINVPNNTETEVFSQNLDLSKSRYCLFLVTALVDISPAGGFTWSFFLYNDSSSLLGFSNNFYYNNGVNADATSNFHCFSQINSGSHTISLKAQQNSGTSGIIKSNTTRMTIIQFAF